MRRLLSVRKGSMLLFSVFALATVSGCTANAAAPNFLDFLNTVLLGITAAGGLVLINNV